MQPPGRSRPIFGFAGALALALLTTTQSPGAHAQSASTPLASSAGSTNDQAIRAIYEQLSARLPPLSPAAVDIIDGDDRYWYDDGRWYLQSAAGFARVRPRAGLVVSSLPSRHATAWVDGVRYEYADDVYYARVPGGFAVAEPGTPLQRSNPRAGDRG